MLKGSIHEDQDKDDDDNDGEDNELTVPKKKGGLKQIKSENP